MSARHPSGYQVGSWKEESDTQRRSGLLALLTVDLSFPPCNSLIPFVFVTPTFSGLSPLSNSSSLSLPLKVIFCTDPLWTCFSTMLSLGYSSQRQYIVEHLKNFQIHLHTRICTVTPKSITSVQISPLISRSLYLTEYRTLLPGWPNTSNLVYPKQLILLLWLEVLPTWLGSITIKFYFPQCTWRPSTQEKQM